MEAMDNGTNPFEVPVLGDITNTTVKATEMLSNNLSSEAGGVVWMEIYRDYEDQNGNTIEVKVNLTARGVNSIDALDDLMTTLNYAQSTYSFRPYKRYSQAPGSTASQASVSAPITPVVPLASNQPNATVMATDPNIASGSTMNIVKMVVTPRTDGKAKIDMTAVGRSFPELYMIGTPEQLATNFQRTGAWTPEHFQKLGNYTVNYKVAWKYSGKVSSQGNPYKDVVRIDPS